MIKKVQAFGKYVKVSGHHMVRKYAWTGDAGYVWECSKCDWSIFLEAKTLQAARSELARNIIFPEQSCDERVVEMVMDS